MQTLAVSRRGEPVENMLYDLAGTPCEEVLHHEVCLVPRDVQTRFAGAFFVRHGIVSYLGTAVFGADGEILGVVSLMHSRELLRPELFEAILRLVADRAGAEMERVAAERALRASKARLAAVIDNSPGVAVRWYDREGRVLRWNRASEQVFGFTAEEAMGKTLDVLIHTPEEFRGFLQTLAEIERTGRPIGPAEYTFRRRNGESGVCLSTLFKIPGEDHDWFVCMDIDITESKRAEAERRHLEERVWHSQKLESLGVMAGGIAHDFNNLLTSMLGYASLAAMELPADSPARPLLGEIENAARRAAELTRQMLAYSGRGKILVQPIRLVELVEEMSKLLLTVVSKKATFRFDLAPVTVEGDATQIRQVVMNLITNASDALGKEAGVVILRTGKRRLEGTALVSRFVDARLPAGEYAFLEVEDSGCGMDEVTVLRIFDPFFTTKFTGRGLGLAAVLGIVRGHGGTLQVDTKPGRGTRFTVILPVAGTGAVEQPAKTKVAAGERSTGTVLLIDDEADVRHVARAILERAGFTVIEAADGEHGLVEFDARLARPDVVLVDLVMPRADGWEVLQRIRRIDPDVPVVLMSGYTDAVIPPIEAGMRAPRFLPKPFGPDDLLTAVHAAIRCE